MFDQPKPKNLVLSVDIMYFTGLMFLTTVSQNVIFITASLLENRRKQTILQEIQKVFNIYQGKGHEVNNVEFLTHKILQYIHYSQTMNSNLLKRK